MNHSVYFFDLKHVIARFVSDLDSGRQSGDVELNSPTSLRGENLR